jgi:hypothetical protein
VGIRTSRCTIGVVETGGRWKKFSKRKVLNILFGHLWVVELTYSKDKTFFFFKFILKVPKCEIFHRSDFHDFHTIKSLWGGGGGRAASVKDTGGKNATGVNDQRCR